MANEALALSITLAARDVAALEYVLPIWNARRALERFPPLTATDLCSELLQEALWSYVRAFRTNEAASLAAIVHARPELLEQLRELVGLPAPPTPPVVIAVTTPTSGGEE